MVEEEVCEGRLKHTVDSSSQSARYYEFRLNMDESSAYLVRFNLVYCICCLVSRCYSLWVVIVFVVTLVVIVVVECLSFHFIHE